MIKYVDSFFVLYTFFQIDGFHNFGSQILQFRTSFLLRRISPFGVSKIRPI